MKKKSYLIKELKERVCKDKNRYFTALFVIAAGFLIGIITAVILNESRTDALNNFLNNFFSAYSLQSVSKAEVFKLSLAENIRTVLVIFIGEFSIFLMPISLLHLGGRSFRLGFLIAFIIRYNFLKGAFLTFIAILPHNIIFMTALVAYCAFTMSVAYEISKVRKDGNEYKNRKKLYIKSLKPLFIVFLFVLCTSLFEGFIVPTLIKIII